MSTKREQSYAVEEVLGDLNVPVCQLRQISKADIKGFLKLVSHWERWKREEDADWGNLWKLNVRNRVMWLVWDGLQDYIAKAEHLNAVGRKSQQ